MSSLKLAEGQPRRDKSRAVYFRTSQATYDSLVRYAAESEMTLATAIITLVRDGIKRADSERGAQPDRAQK